MAGRRNMSQKKELQEAMQGTDVTALCKALDQATEVGVEQELIEAGQQRCDDMVRDMEKKVADMFLVAFDKVGVISEIPYGPPDYTQCGILHSDARHATCI